MCRRLWEARLRKIVSSTATNVVPIDPFRGRASTTSSPPPPPIIPPTVNASNAE
ncbi:conserved hypothetical protein [Ricinus communis]|uniref:Uncharacterized protein n=1 Tax=Ricinus communis TaxID=3988 RepID=B9S4J9_RICCO|nr:conserved hypothetical protein [Ricinus communis]